MNENKISDYFVISGVPDRSNRESPIVFHPKLDPITDIAVINRSNHEPIPHGYECIEKTPNNHEANLNHGSLQGSKFFICYKRGRDKEPLLDIGVFYHDNTNRVSPDCKIIKKTPSGFPANLNTGGSTKIYLTFRRSNKMTYNQLVVTDICVILTSKNECPPHAYCLIEKNLNKGYFGFGSDAYLCYKKSLDRPPHLIYSPVIIDRFPNEENPEYQLPQDVPLFCLPMGASIECWPRDDALFTSTSFSTFILTTSIGMKIYGTLLNYHEELSPEMLTADELEKLNFNYEDINKTLENKALFTIKSMCILSQWPFFDQFRNFLIFLYQNFIYKPSTIPLELYVFHFMKNIPFPTYDRPNIQVNLSPSCDDLIFSQNFDDFPIPSNGASFKKLLLNLGAENCLHLLLFMLTEQKILLHSLRLSVLTEIAEALVAMIFPFNWNCPYIPLCPLNLCEVLHAPLPFIVGIYSQYFESFDAPNDVISIDIDTRAIYLSDTKRFLNLKLFPKKEMRLLKEKLEDIYKRLELNNKTVLEVRKKNEKQFEIEIQEAFLHFMASILKDFQHFLKPITAAPKVGATDPTTLFDFDGFLQAHENNISFYRQLTKTQMFTNFIEERSLVSDKNISLAFFDDCIEKVEKYEKLNLKKISELNLINIDGRVKSSKTVFISIPFLISEVDHQQSQTFNGRLNNDLFQKFETIYKSNLKTMPSDSIDSSGLDSELQCYSFAKRAKHEVLKAQKIAEQSYRSPSEWAKCLLMNAYSLWFTHFPAFSYLLNQQSGRTTKPLSIAYQALKRMQTMDFSVPDEFCYRILMILCSIHSRPALAVKIFLDMKHFNVKLNAITYGYYNKAVLDGDWPLECNSKARWIKLCNVMKVLIHFQKHIRSTNEIMISKKSAFCFKEKPNNELIVDYCTDAGILFNPIQINSISTQVNANSLINRKRNKSGNINEKQNHISKEELKKIANDLLEWKNTHYFGNFNTDNFDTESNKEINSEKSVKNGSEEDNVSEKNIFSNSFVTPIKASLDFSKSPVADKLRSSFRIAKNFTKSQYSFARNFYDPEKNVNRIGSLFVKPETKNENSNSFWTPPKLSRSSTLPQSFQSTKASFTSTPLQAYGIGSPSEYFYSTVKSIGGRINEFKLSLGTSSTNSPVKFNVVNRLIFKNEEENINQSIDNLLDAFDENSFDMEKYQNILNDYYTKPFDLFQSEQSSQIVFNVKMISGTICRKCDSIIYDEEIMCKWFADDSNLNTECIHCGTTFVPSLTVYIKDFRHQNKIDGSIDPISVPYLSPLVLRKELENILNMESYSSLIMPKFVDDHPIVYWNLIWYFNRLNLPSHITELALSATTLNSAEIIEMNKKQGYNFKNVSIICMWDNEKFYQNLPLYQNYLNVKKIENEKLDPSLLDFKNLCEELIQLIKEKNLSKPIQFLISERNKFKKQTDFTEKNLNSLYRELIFLNLMQQIPPLDPDLFDEEYRLAFESLTQKDKDSLNNIDKPLTSGAIYCRNLFKQLALVETSSI